MKKIMNLCSKLAVCLYFLALLFIDPGIARAAECPTIDHEHGAWNSILQRWVSDGRVDYAALQREGRAPLKAYLTELSATCAIDYEKWSRTASDLLDQCIQRIHRSIDN